MASPCIRLRELAVSGSIQHPPLWRTDLCTQGDGIDMPKWIKASIDEGRARALAKWSCHQVERCGEGRLVRSSTRLDCVTAGRPRKRLERWPGRRRQLRRPWRRKGSGAVSPDYWNPGRRRRKKKRRTAEAKKPIAPSANRRLLPPRQQLQQTPSLRPSDGCKSRRR